MKKRVASLILLIVIAGGSFAGVPLHFGEESSCPMAAMGDMGDMDCCKMALMQSESPEAAAAKLCCALSCAQNGTTSPPSVLRVTPLPANVSSHPATTQVLPRSSMRFDHADRLHDPPGSPPTYLRNLALLI